MPDWPTDRMLTRIAERVYRQMPGRLRNEFRLAVIALTTRDNPAYDPDRLNAPNPAKTEGEGGPGPIGCGLRDPDRHDDTETERHPPTVRGGR